MEATLRVEHVGGLGEGELRALFAAHGWVTSVEFAPELVAGAAGGESMVPCARVTFRTRTADDAANAAMQAINGRSLGGGSVGARVDYAPPERPAAPEPVAALASTAAACSLSGSAPAAPRSAPLAVQSSSTHGSGHASAQPSPLAGGSTGSVFASPLRRGGGGPPPPPAAASAEAAGGLVAQPQPQLGQELAQATGAYGGYAQPPPPPTAYVAPVPASLPPAACGYAYGQASTAYGYAPPVPPQPAEPAQTWQPGQSRLAYGTDQGRFLNEALSQRAAAGAGPNPYRAQRPL